MSKWLLHSLEITDGFLPGLDLRFSPKLTCIIGPRGSGKSTLAEALRYAVGGKAAMSNPKLFEKNLSRSVITLHTAPLDGESGYVIRRAPGQGPSLTTADGRTVPSVDIDRGTFRRLDAYNSQQISDIAEESLGPKRRALLDELREEPLRQIALTLGEARRKLAGNAALIAASEEAITDFTEQMEEAGDVRARLASLPSAPGGAARGLERVSHEQQATEADLDALAEARESLTVFQNSLAEFLREQKAAFAQNLARETSPNIAIMRAAADALHALFESAARRVNELSDEAETVKSSLAAARAEVEGAHTERAGELARLQQENAAASQAVRERQQAEMAVKKLEQLEARRTAERDRLTALRKERETLKAAYLLERENISTLRHEVAVELQRKVGDTVRVRVLRNADNSAYRDMLLAGLKNSRVKNHDDLVRDLMMLRPEELAQIIQERDVIALDGHAEFGPERSARVIEAFAQNLKPRELEIVEIDDRISIELNVAGAGASPLFKDASELSDGQKCTALLPLLLSRRETPLVIDQPEDNLDNHFIFETVVEAVRRLKQTRQLIFITHNANIPVLAEAEQVVVLDSDGKRGRVVKTGTLDGCRSEIIDLLEGGREAFERRRERYAKP